VHTLTLSKHHGLGNDFLVALVDRVPDDPAALARRWCHRTRGIGADGLIFGVGPALPDPPVAMVLHNADGSPAEISGNGIRCLAHAMARRAKATDLRLTIETVAGPRELTVAAGPDDLTRYVSVDMGLVTDGPEVPAEVSELYPGRPVATARAGNPHIVIEVDELADLDLASAGPAVQRYFEPEGINVHFLQAVDGGIALAHYERGSGITAACGSGATAAATIAHRWRVAPATVTVTMPGGQAVVDTERHLLSGPVTYVATIEVPV
jgi:diaminopimelate epimerase